MKILKLKKLLKNNNIKLVDWNNFKHDLFPTRYVLYLEYNGENYEIWIENNKIEKQEGLNSDLLKILKKSLEDNSQEEFFQEQENYYPKY